MYTRHGVLVKCLVEPDAVIYMLNTQLVEYQHDTYPPPICCSVEVSYCQ